MHKSSRTIQTTPADTAVLTVPEAAHFLGIGVTAVYKLIASGELKSMTFGKSRRVTRAACLQLIAKRESEAA